VHRSARVLVAILALFGPSCGGSKTSGGLSSPGFQAPPSATVTTPSTTQGHTILISYMVADAASTTASAIPEYSTDGGLTFHPATQSINLGAVTPRGLATSPAPGTAYVFAWNSIEDGVGLGAANPAVQFRMTPASSQTGTPATTGNFSVDNSANTPPSVSITIPTVGSTKSGTIHFQYDLVDANSDVCTIVAEFSTDGGLSYAPLTPGYPSVQTSLLTGDPAGVTAGLDWDSPVDIPSSSGATPVIVRITPRDGVTGSGATRSFTVDNTGMSSGVPGPPTLGPAGQYTAAGQQSTRTSVYLAGETAGGTPGDTQWIVQKIGLSASAFGTSGTLTWNPGPGRDRPVAVIVPSPHVYILARKETANGSGVFRAYVEKRAVVSGALFATFNGTGTLELPDFDGSAPLSIRADGSFLYIAGSERLSATDARWRVEKRDRTSGTLVTDFASGGVLTEDISGNLDQIHAILLDATSMWLAGTEDAPASGVGPPTAKVRFEKRLLIDGSRVASFGVNGVLTEDPSPGSHARATDLESDGVSLVAFVAVSSGAATAWRLEKRALTDGALTLAVAAGGSTPSAIPLEGNRLFVDGANLYVAGTDDAGAGDARWRIEKRLLSTLTLVGSFGSAGTATLNPVASAPDVLNGFAVGGGIVYTAGSDFAGAGPSDELRRQPFWK